MLLQHQHLAARLREDLGGAKSSRTGTDDQVLNGFHASSLRIRSAVSARAAVVGLGTILHFRS
jgi:hypothetical protein